VKAHENKQGTVLINLEKGSIDSHLSREEGELNIMIPKNLLLLLLLLLLIIIITIISNDLNPHKNNI